MNHKYQKQNCTEVCRGWVKRISVIYLANGIFHGYEPAALLRCCDPFSVGQLVLFPFISFLPF
jgi:hypothetical protein